MRLSIAGLLLSAALPSRAAIIESLPMFSAAPAPASAGALPALAAPALFVQPFAAPALFAPSLAAAPVPALAAPSAAAPAPAVVLDAAAPAPALTAAPAAAPNAGEGRPATEQAAADAARRFDGGWSRGSFESADGLEVAFKRRAVGAGKIPRVYSGGLALNESFESLFVRPAAPVRPEYFVWTRGHRPTAWTPTKDPIDGDARDLARMIVLAARETGATKVELALHSFGTLVFQRLVQLHEEPEAAAALQLLAGSRVFLLNAITHYQGSAGPKNEATGQAASRFVDSLDLMDRAAEAWRAAADLNPFLAPAAALWMAQYQAQRGRLMALAARRAADKMSEDLSAPWDPAVDSIRRGFIAALQADAKDPGWQESLLRRSTDLFRLEFTKRDVARVRRLRIHLELLHASQDQLLDWGTALTLFERFGIRAPEAPPAPGTVLTDPTGRFRATIVDGDHYYPLKRRDDLARRLEP